MTLSTLRMRVSRIRCPWRPLILAGAGLLLLTAFWLVFRYPQLTGKAGQVGEIVPTMAFSSQVLFASVSDPIWWRILTATVNWLDSMKIGMSFGVLLGALLHTVLRHYPLKIGKNLHLNSLKGAVIGAPMGVCANCAVPTACGITRGNGRVEVALGFLFSSPNFNPVVMTMTFVALPFAMAVTKYVILLAVILLIVPCAIRWLERDKPLQVHTADSASDACSIPLEQGAGREPFGTVLVELGREYGKNIWMLIKPTVVLMALASVAAASMLVLVPWETLLADPTPTRLALVSLCSVFMPVPIALDVLFAAQLQSQGAPAGYVMLFLMTLGTYSIIPAVYLWREVSKPLAVSLFGFFLVIGWATALAF